MIGSLSSYPEIDHLPTLLSHCFLHSLCCRNSWISCLHHLPLPDISFCKEASFHMPILSVCLSVQLHPGSHCFFIFYSQAGCKRLQGNTDILDVFRVGFAHGKQQFLILSFFTYFRSHIFILISLLWRWSWVSYRSLKAGVKGEF